MTNAAWKTGVVSHTAEAEAQHAVWVFGVYRAIDVIRAPRTIGIVAAAARILAYTTGAIRRAIALRFAEFRFADSKGGLLPREIHVDTQERLAVIVIGMDRLDIAGVAGRSKFVAVRIYRDGRYIDLGIVGAGSDIDVIGLMCVLSGIHKIHVVGMALQKDTWA